MLVIQMCMVNRKRTKNDPLGYTGMDVEAVRSLSIDFSFDLLFIYVRFRQVKIS